MKNLRNQYIFIVFLIIITGCSSGSSSSSATPASEEVSNNPINIGVINLTESSYQINIQPSSIPFNIGFDTKKSTVTAQITTDLGESLNVNTSAVICTDNNPNENHYKSGVSCNLETNYLSGNFSGSLKIMAEDTHNLTHSVTAKLSFNLPINCTEPTQHISVGFIGNSLTYVNDLPNTLVILGLQSCPVVVFDVSKKILAGGITLRGVRGSWSNLNNNNFPANVDYIVYQEQSGGVILNDTKSELYVLPDPDLGITIPGLYQLSIGDTKAIPILFQTWPIEYSRQFCFTKGRSDVDVKNKQIPDDYRNLTGYMNSESGYPTKKTYMSPVGDAWVRYVEVLEENAKIGQEVCTDLYSDDVHPTYKGTYLASLVFYSTLTGKSPNGLYAPASFAIPIDEQLILQKIAWETYENTPYAKIESL